MTAPRLPRQRIWCLFSAIFASAAWQAVPSARAADFVSPGELATAKLAKYWQLALSLAPEQSLTRVYLVEDQIYAATNDGYVFAVHARTGALRWINPVASGAYPIARPCHIGQRVAFVLPPEVQVYERITGDPLMKKSLGFPAGGAPISDGERLFFGGLDRRFYALGRDNLFTKWRVLTEGQITAAPAIFGDYIYFASEDGRVYACNRENKKFQWKYSTYGPITADLVATEDGVYVASRDNSLYLLDILFGKVRWRARLGGPLIDPPVVVGPTAFQYSARDGLVAIDTQLLESEDQRVLWKLKEGRSALTADDRYAYVLTLDEAIAVVDRKSGEVKQRIAAPGFTMAMPDVVNQSLIVAAADGRLFCARSLEAPYVRSDDVRGSLQPSRAGEAAVSQPADGATSQPAEGETPVASDTPPVPERPELPPRSGPAVGGRSKVSRDFGKPGGGQ